jgi:hypothetical protein
VQDLICARIPPALTAGLNVVLDATVHEAPPEAYFEYQRRFRALEVRWTLRILHPSLEVAIARDAQRPGWRAGSERVTSLHAKFSGATFPTTWFLDTSRDSIPETVARLLSLSVG